MKIESSNGGEEFISPDQTITGADHGGTFLRIAVREIGYALEAREITLNGTAIPDTPVSVTPLCGEQARVRLCERGEGQLGYIRVYEIGATEGGLFNYITRNASLPFDYFNIKFQIK